MIDHKTKLELGIALYRAGISLRKSADLVSVAKSTLFDEVQRKGESLRFTSLALDFNNPHIKSVAQRAMFLDIETSTVQGHSFGVGKHARFTYSGLSNNQETKILSVVYGSLYDLMTSGMDGLKVLNADLVEGGVDDTALIHTMNEVMTNDMDHLIAHNARFDQKWLYGRMMMKGLTTPRVNVVDTMALFRHGNMLCKKLDYLSDRFLGSRKISTSMSDWINIIEGDNRQGALDFMSEYNKVDVFLMLPLYLIGARYNPNACVDFTNLETENPNCKVTGEIIKCTGTYTNPTTSNKYSVYTNRRLGIEYVNRRMIGSRKAAEHLLKHHI